MSCHCKAAPLYDSSITPRGLILKAPNAPRLREARSTSKDNGWLRVIVWSEDEKST
jgi:hypothetical protein